MGFNLVPGFVVTVAGKPQHVGSTQYMQQELEVAAFHLLTAGKQGSWAGKVRA